MQTPVRKAVIPAAGHGTRMLPAAKAVAKELLPILDRPTIQYVVEEAASAGCRSALLITSRDKRGLEDHFDSAPELERRLHESGRDHLLQSITDLRQRIQVHAVRQASPRGLGDAVSQARRHVGDEPFLCLLGDAIFSGGVSPAQQLVAAHEQLGTSIIGVEMVDPGKVERYGIVAGESIGDGVVRVRQLVEKPRRDQAPSRMAIAARYLLTPAIFDCLDHTPAGKGGEIQLTDALQLLLEREPVHAVILHATRHDIGNPVDWLATNLIFARRQPELWSKLAPLLEPLLNSKEKSGIE